MADPAFHVTSASMAVTRVLLERTASLPDMKHIRCASAGHTRCYSAGRSRPPPRRVPLAALHWSPGGRCPEALKADWLSQSHRFSGGGCRQAALSRCREYYSIVHSERQQLRPQLQQQHQRQQQQQRRASSKTRHSPEDRPELVSLAISGTRPASASGPRLQRTESALCGENGHPFSEPSAIESQTAIRLPDVPAISEDLRLPLLPTLGAEWRDLTAPLVLPSVSLVACNGGEMLGTVTLDSEAQARALWECFFQCARGRQSCEVDNGILGWQCCRLG